MLSLLPDVSDNPADAWEPCLNAGATWVDEEVRICRSGPNVLVTSRKPDDLKAFRRTAVEVFAAVV